MIIFGFKFTHDGAIALIDKNKLIFSYEMEKLDNSERYSVFNISFARVNKILENYGYSFDHIDCIVIDGWHSSDGIYIDWAGEKCNLQLAEYGNSSDNGQLFKAEKFKLPGFQNISYLSYNHVAGHIACAYCTSPFATSNEDSYILVWDGGMFPQLFYFNAATKIVDSLGDLFPVTGDIYSIFSQYFGPFKKEAKNIKNSSSVAGKIMAYIALGKYKQVIMDHLIEAYNSEKKEVSNYPHLFAEKFISTIKGKDLSDEDVLYTFHVFIEKLLVKGLKLKVGGDTHRSKNFCFVGGSALNIKWNSAIRNTNLFENVWIPPFPNDSGSAIGTACCEMIHRSDSNKLEWNVYSGPPVIESLECDGWEKKKMSIKELASLINITGEPIVFLNGNAELGPRALGNRSIISIAVNIKNKNYLNDIKQRESYRPVAPICLEEYASEIFSPGYSDHYMLFDHYVKDDWKQKIPAVCHLDGTARLQTINNANNPVMYELLNEYHKLSGIPLLCNTSANFNGKGFFPDVNSVMKWNQVNYIWNNDNLYEKRDKIIFK